MLILSNTNLVFVVVNHSQSFKLHEQRIMGVDYLPSVMDVLCLDHKSTFLPLPLLSSMELNDSSAASQQHDNASYAFGLASKSCATELFYRKAPFLYVRSLYV